MAASGQAYGTAKSALPVNDPSKLCTCARRSWDERTEENLEHT